MGRSQRPGEPLCELRMPALQLFDAMVARIDSRKHACGFQGPTHLRTEKHSMLFYDVAVEEVRTVAA